MPLFTLSLPYIVILTRLSHSFSFFFFFNDTATTEIYTLSLHDALPIYRPRRPGFRCTRIPPLSPPPRRNLRARSIDRKSTRLNSSHVKISYAVFCLKKKKKKSIAHEKK